VLLMIPRWPGFTSNGWRAFDEAQVTYAAAKGTAVVMGNPRGRRIMGRRTAAR
jgi:hypothetical protein